MIIEQKCQEKGIRMTPQRSVVAHVLENSTDPVSVKEVYEDAKKNNKEITISSSDVQRVMNVFEKEGIIERRYRDNCWYYVTISDDNTPVKAVTVEQRCQEKGIRMTEQRCVVARVLQNSTDHPSVEELYRRAVKIDSNISISTVYRTMKILKDEGIIEQHDFRDGHSRYECISENHHDHLIDIKSGDIIEFSSPEIERLQEKIAIKHGYKLVDHRLELYAIPLSEKNET